MAVVIEMAVAMPMPLTAAIVVVMSLTALSLFNVNHCPISQLPPSVSINRVTVTLQGNTATAV